MPSNHLGASILSRVELIQQWYRVQFWIHTYGKTAKAASSNNKFQGTLSDKIINLQELEVFNCSENFIHGSIPYQLGGLQRLRTVDLSNNKLTGTTPKSFLQLIYLEKLSLMNQMSKGGVGIGGRLPNFLSNQALTEIKLNGNSLTGTIPSNSLQVLDPSLVVSVDLRSNQLSGALPNDLMRFDHLEILLVDNKITQLPRSYCSESKWMNGSVGSYGCNAILCPANSHNSAAGRQESNENPISILLTASETQQT